jgi:hypothetical protein
MICISTRTGTAPRFCSEVVSSDGNDFAATLFSVFDTASGPFRTGWAAKAATPRVRFLNPPTLGPPSSFSHDA